MSKHLILGGDPTAANWRLPSETNVDELTDRLKIAMTAGTVETVVVEMGDDPLTRADLLVNGRVVASATVVELPEPEPRTLRAR